MDANGQPESEEEYLAILARLSQAAFAIPRPFVSAFENDGDSPVISTLIKAGRSHHEREDVDMAEQELNAFDMEPLHDAWLCGYQLGGRILMTRKQFDELIGSGAPLPDRLARGVRDRKLMMAIAYAIANVKLIEDKGDASDHAPDP